jgi:hypothetical protein
MALQGCVLNFQVWVVTQVVDTSTGCCSIICAKSKLRILMTFKCPCYCYVTCMLDVTKLFGIWFQWGLRRASNLLIAHVKTNGTSLKPFPFNYGFFPKGQNTQHVGYDIKPLL